MNPKKISTDEARSIGTQLELIGQRSILSNFDVGLRWNLNTEHLILRQM